MRKKTHHIGKIWCMVSFLFMISIKIYGNNLIKQKLIIKLKK